MTFTFTMVDRESGQTANVYVDGDDTRAVGELVAEAERLIATDVVASGRTPAYFVGEQPLDLAATVAESGVREGVVVARSLEQVPPRPLRPLTDAEIRIVSGLHAGTIVRVTTGTVTIGTATNATVRIPVSTTDEVEAEATGAETVPEVALLVSVTADGAKVRPANGFAGAVLDGEPVTEETDWPETAQLAIGGVLLGFGRAADRGAHLSLADDGMSLEYNRPPRILPPDEHTRYQLPAPPTEPPARALPLLMALAPMGMAVMFVSTTGRWIYLLIALLSPILMIITGLQGRRQGKKTYRQRIVEYEDTKARIEADATESLQSERARWIASAPDPAAVYETAVTPLPRLWERRRTDPDHLLVRVGTATQRSEVTIEDPEQLSHKRTVAWDATDVPVRIRLAERGVIGIAGPDDDARRLANWVVAQLATLQSPKDVTFTLLTDTTRTALWEWMSWLPHVRRDGADQPMTSIASNAATTARAIAELAAVIDARKEAGIGKKTPPADEIVVVMDGARRLRAMPSLVQVLKEGPSVGVFSICLDLDERLLPEECDAVVVVRDDRIRVTQQRSERIDDARPDLVDQDWLEWVARSLSPIVDASPDVQDGAIPSSARLLDVLQLEPPTSEAVQARWLLGGRSTTAVIGASIDGPFAIDLRNDGPHGLVAGTTGSGKSELLQTIVASLAVANRPDEMNFVLVDYKGGAAFKDCVDLPHTVGMVTDLDTHQVERALESLGAELRTREHALAEVGAKDLEDYQDLQAKRAASGDAIPSLPRLLIVIDEFASLARELPDFVKGLVNIAQRGRSLGIHLVLATQRPGGVVSPEIRANTNLRIALRVTDQSESQDVIGANDAARIAKTTPGRAYVRLGAASLLPFQSGRVGGRRPGTDDQEARPALVRELTFASYSEPAPRPAAVEAAASDVEVTDLSVLVASIGDATRALGTPEQRKPWLPPLGAAVGLDDVEAAGAAGTSDLPALAVAWGIEDHPADQQQRPAVFDLDADGHLFVIGSPRSGRSQTLRTLAGAMALRLGVGDVHMYGIDCGNGALLALGALPHCGAVVQRHEPDRVSRLLGILLRTVQERQAAFASGGYSSIAEQRSDEHTTPLPHVVVFLDQWESFMATLADAENGALHDAVQTLLREGVGVGVHLIVSGDRTLTSGRMSSQVERKLLLALADRGDYNYEGINGKKLPESIPPGRGFRNATATETQVAVLPGGLGGRDQAAAIRGIGDEVRAHVPATVPKPFRIDVLPRSITFEDAVRYLPSADASVGRVALGVGGDELRLFTHDFVQDTPVFIVAGSPRSGKSTALVAMARHVLSAGGSVVAVTPRDSPLRALEGAPRATVVTDGGIGAEGLSAAIDTGSDGFTLVLVDDAEALKETPAEPVFRAIMDSDRGRSVGLVIAGDVEGVASGFRGWQVDAKKARRGMLLAPLSTVDGDLIGTKLSKSLVTQDRVPGRALLNDADQALRLVQVPAD